MQPAASPRTAEAAGPAPARSRPAAPARMARPRRSLPKPQVVPVAAAPAVAAPLAPHNRRWAPTAAWAAAAVVAGLASFGSKAHFQARRSRRHRLLTRGQGLHVEQLRHFAAVAARCSA